MVLTPVALSPALPSELLSYILTHQAHPSTLIICQPRAAFLSSLLAAINHTSPPPNPFETDHSEPSSPSPETPAERHPLLIPTLHQIAISRYLNVVFIPTVSHLRAYLAVFPPPISSAPPDRGWDRPGKKVPLLVVYGLVALHRDTSEWSAQGLGNSCAALIEAGWRARRRVVLLEEKAIEDGDIDVDEELIEGGGSAAGNVWGEKVPMLNGSVRRAGMESEDGGWSGRTIEVGRVLGRWFKFRKGDWDSSDA